MRADLQPRTFPNWSASQPSCTDDVPQAWCGKSGMRKLSVSPCPGPHPHCGTGQADHHKTLEKTELLPEDFLCRASTVAWLWHACRAISTQRQTPSSHGRGPTAAVCQRMMRCQRSVKCYSSTHPRFGNSGWALCGGRSPRRPVRPYGARAERESCVCQAHHQPEERLQI